MADEIHIASFIVHHRPEALAALEALAADRIGLEIALRDEGRAILLHECGDPRDLLDCMDAAQAIAGVISTNLVYHHAEPRGALDDLRTPSP
ncbi:periplasmic nitrate reductase chaperone NapD [Sphingomonas laterariae]|uniref:Chaperone NapD n=1 Tax=Edaphosphingomonas laterariae TaxID=861865 RepID=A0A239BVR6_9SPHN|nr:chaperone NapD [Sphingomonas laterariae]SNS11528.1 periplasmic nitrate reductase chaperone NapD [Sphingomonas laterariae]